MTPPVASREIGISYALLAFTLLACALLARDLGTILVAHLEANRLGQALEQGAFGLIVAIFLYGNLVYQVTRVGHLRRQRRHRPAPWGELERVYESQAPRLALPIPSYKEEARVIRQALLSAALQEYPNRHVVLLIDDPAEPRDVDATRALCAARRLPDRLREHLARPAARFRAELEAFAQRQAQGPLDRNQETRRVAALYAEAAAWLEVEAAKTPKHDHTDRHFVRLVLAEPAQRHRQRTMQLEIAVRRGGALDQPALQREYRRLAALFDVQITRFERKRYVNLSHEPNKAMNLNSYIGLMGGSYREVGRLDGLHLEPAESGAADVTFPDATYLVTLDADSLLASDYALRLLQPDAAARERTGRHRTDALQRGARPSRKARADCRCDDGHPVHHPPRIYVLRRLLLGRSQCLPAQGGARRPEGGPPGTRLRGVSLHLRPDRHRGHRIDRRSDRQGMDPAQLSRAAGLQRHPTRFRCALDPAPTLGEWGAADPAQAAALPQLPAVAPAQAGRSDHAPALPGVDRRRECQPAGAPDLSLRASDAEPMAAGLGPAVLHAVRLGSDPAGVP